MPDVRGLGERRHTDDASASASYGVLVPPEGCQHSGDFFSLFPLCHPSLPVFDQIHDHFGQNVLLVRTAFCNHQRDGDQRVVGDMPGTVGAVKDAVLLHEPEKQGGANALVSVHETVVLDEKIEKMCSLFPEYPLTR